MTPYRRWGAVALGPSLVAGPCGGHASGGSGDVAAGSTQANTEKDEADKIGLTGTSTTATTGARAVTARHR